jgi:N-acetylglucosamine malate deacetylase 1
MPAPASVTPVDLLVFGPHPDDIEIGCGGAVASHVDAGARVGLCDLTAGEMGSNGTVDERLREAEAAREVLGASWRVNLRWPDRAIGGSDQVRSAVRLIREARPRTILVPYWSDRHPDHVASSQVLTEAAFSAGLRRFDAGVEAWKAEWTVYYFINDGATPSFTIDVSSVYGRKRQSLACYVSQFQPPQSGSVPTRLTSARFQQLIESRDAQFGALTGCEFAEGFVVREPVALSSLFRNSGAEQK